MEDEEIMKSVSSSLEADESIMQYMPYLLQDLWALGSSVEQIIASIAGLNLITDQINVLDLGCGKGAVSIQVASRFGYNVTGVDAMKAFLNDANRVADEYGVTHLCNFIEEDILKYTSVTHNFDIVILASLGGVFGNVKETMRRLRSQVRNTGYIIIDDGFLRNEKHVNRKGYEHCADYKRTIELLTSFGDKIIAEVNTTEVSKNINEEYLNLISNRSKELITQHPNAKSKIEQYITLQKEECEFLDKNFNGVLWVIQKC